MRTHLSRVTGLLVAALWVFAAGTSVASAGAPIQPDQHFLGFVNGSRATPVVYTVCPGPAAPGRLGPVAGGLLLSTLATMAATAWAAQGLMRKGAAHGS